MIAPSLLGLLTGATLGVASPTRRYVNHVVHESRDHTPAQWAKRDSPLNPHAALPLRFGLRQQNLHRMYDFLDRVSNPQSETYGQHWTHEEVASTFAPSDESITAVTEWLLETGIADHRIEMGSSRLWISVNTTVEEAEMLLHTKYHAYDHDITGQGHVACDGAYSIPQVLSEHHVDLVVPTLHFDVPVQARAPAPTNAKVDADAERMGRRADRRADKRTDPRSLGIGPSLADNVALYRGQDLTVQEELDSCNITMTPTCLRALYSFPQAKEAVKGNTFGVVEFSPAAYLGSDLDLYFDQYAPELVGERPIEVGIDGGAEQNFTYGFNYQGMANADLMVAMSLVAPQKVTLLQAGDNVEGASFNNVLDALDASYCTYDGGDDPVLDPQYPDTQPGGYNGRKSCGIIKPPAVLSTSVSLSEAQLTPFYEERQCHEYAKLGLMGTTVLYAASNYGTAGVGDLCLVDDGSQVHGSGRFNPTFPGSCPYVTSVGVTEVQVGIDFAAGLAKGEQVEEAMSLGDLFPGYGYSGGGFSNVFEMPAYQADAVHHYLATTPLATGTDQYFNSTGRARAFPDVSAAGVDYAVVVDGQTLRTAGTGSSTPTFGSLITQINGERLATGKSTVGFINPVLYAFPEVLRDVTIGVSPGCGSEGFPAAEGWDPVTGLGTPNYPKMLELFMLLP